MSPAELTSRLADRKRTGPPLAALTAYDYPTARLLDEAGIDVVLVGDSLGMVVLGMPDTTGVTLGMVEHHTRAVRRGVARALLLADLPIDSYRNPAEAVASARRLRDAGADGVKLEGGGPAECAALAAIVGDGIPVCAHLGMLPQHVIEEGGYRRKGRTPEEAERLRTEAAAVEAAGASAVVLEIVERNVAAAIGRSLRIPTIGIGAGPDCDGQVLVLHDVLGLSERTFTFAKAFGNLRQQVVDAAAAYVGDVRSGARPDEDHSFR